MCVFAPFGTQNCWTKIPEVRNLMALTEAAVGAILGELLKALLEIKGKIEEYNSILNRIEATLIQIEPIVREIDDLNRKLDRQGVQTKLLWEEIKRGKELLQCCKKEIGGCCSCLQKQQYQYLGRLQELDKSLSSFYNIVVSLHTLREVIRTRDVVEDVRDMVREGHAQRDDHHKHLLEEIKDLKKLMVKDTPADTSNKAPRQGNSPVRVPERSVTPVPDQKKQVPGEYGRANSKGKDGGGASDYESSFATAAVPVIPSKGKESPSFNGSLPTGKILAAPKEYAPPSPVPQMSGFSQVRPTAHSIPPSRPSPPPKSPEVVREYAPPSPVPQTSGFSLVWPTAHSIPPSRPSPPPKSPEVVRETRREATDPPWQQPHVQPEPKQVKQIPDRAKEVHREPAYSYSPDNKTKISISPVSSNDFIRGASFGKDSPSGRYSSYPIKPAGPATTNYGFSTPPKSPETKAISPTTATTTNNLTSSRPYVPHDSPSSGKDINLKGQARDPSHGLPPYHQPPSAAPPKPQEMETNFVKEPSGYSSPVEKRSTIPTTATRSSDNPLTRSYILQSSQPKPKEVDHNQGNMVPDRWRTGQSISGQNIAFNNYASPANKALPTKVLEIKKGAGEEWSSDDTDE